MKRLFFIVVLALVIVFCIGVAPVVRRLTARHNTPEYFEVRHGVDSVTFERFVAMYGVLPDEIGKYGDLGFPINYIRRKVDWDANRDTGVSLTSVEAEIKGPLALCKEGAYTWWYYFYTLDHDSNREPYVMGLSLEGQNVVNIYPVSLGDSGQEGGLALGCLDDPKRLVKFVQ